MPTLDDLAERIERLLLRHDEAKRIQALLAQQLAAVTTERDGLRQRLAMARARLDALIARLPEPGADGADHDEQGPVTAAPWAAGAAAVPEASTQPAPLDADAERSAPPPDWADTHPPEFPEPPPEAAR